MYPDLLEIFGIDLVGLTFERWLWLAALGLSLWGLVGTWQLWRAGGRVEAAVRGALSLGLLGWAGLRAWAAWQRPEAYQLFFKEELVIHTYAFCIVLGFVVGVWLAWRESLRLGLGRGTLIDAAFWALIAGFLGARLLFVIVGLGDYIDACVAPEKVGLSEADCFLVLKFWQGGVVFYGAFIGGAVAVWLFGRRRKVSVPLLLDAAAPSLALAHAFGRLGCLGAGCCWGEVNTAGWGVVFRLGQMPYGDMFDRYAAGDPVVDPAPLMTGCTAPLHPTQLYEVFGELSIFFMLLAWRGYKRVHGELIAAWVALYGFFRIWSETMRGDRVRGYLFEWQVDGINDFLGLPLSHPTFLSTSQVVGLALGLAGLGLVAWLRRQRAQVRP